MFITNQRYHNLQLAYFGCLHLVAVLPIPRHRKIHGVNPAIKFPPGGNQGIESPLLLWGVDKTWMKFHYETNADNSELTVVNEIVCYQDEVGTVISGTWATTTSVHKKVSKTSGSRCVRLAHNNQSDLCTTFKVKTTITVKHGYVTISDISFGDKEICSISGNKKKKSLKCNFDDGDCGLGNDACGLVDWEIRSWDSTDRRRRSSNCEEQGGVPLLKRKIRDKCSFEDLNIVNLQRSGFIQFTSSSDVESTAVASTSEVYSRRRRTYGRSLYLDPSYVSGVATGVLDLPDLEHHVANSYLSFDCEMLEGGFHDLMVTAVCLSDSDRSLIPLRSESLHFHVTHLHGNGLSEAVCLDLHSFIDSEKCPEFAIQISASAVETSVIVDNFDFLRDLADAYCGK